MEDILITVGVFLGVFWMVLVIGLAIYVPEILPAREQADRMGPDSAYEGTD